MNANKVILIGRLTRDPEVRVFQSGGKVINIGFAVSNRKKNQQTGQWENVPVFLDVSAFQGVQGRQIVDLLANLTKGAPLYIEGHLVLDTWVDNQTNQNRSKLKVHLDDFQFLAQRQQQGNDFSDQGQYQQQGGDPNGQATYQQQAPPPQRRPPQQQQQQQQRPAQPVRRAPQQQYLPQGNYDDQQQVDAGPPVDDGQDIPF